MRRVFRSACPAGAAGLLVAACASGGTVEIAPSGLMCVDDSGACIKARSQALKALMADQKRSWISRSPPPRAYASGVRLFAFKRSKKKLTCSELAIGIREADAGPAILRGSAAGQLSPGQVSRGVILAGEVERELRRESNRRCRKGRS